MAIRFIAGNKYDKQCSPGFARHTESACFSSYSKQTRSAIAELANNRGLTSGRDLDFSEHIIAKHLSESRSPEEDADFFSTRPLTEAIILEKVRPVLFVRNGVVDKVALPEVEA